MAGLRSSLPLRLRQLLSGDGALGPSLKLESEAPPEVKSFIDKVSKSPLQDIAIPLSGFRWEYNKGNFHHWTPLFLIFDTYFKTFVSGRKDLLLSDNLLEESGTFPKHAVLQILRVMQIILENCHGKSSFSGLEHLKALLAATDPEILIATLETLSALVKINPSKLHVSGKLIGCGSLNSYLLSLAQGWGSKEEGLGLYNCVMANEKNQEEHFSLFPSDSQESSDKSQLRLGSTLHFEFYAENAKDKKQHSSNLQVIHIPDLHLHVEDDLTLLNQLVTEFNVPQEHRFSLLTRVRYARTFRSPKTCRLYSRICLLAFIVLVQSNDAHEELVSFFANEPEYTNELIRLVRSEEAVPGTIRTLAMIALGAQLAAYSSSHERARVLSGSSIISASGNRMVLLSVLQKAVHLLSANASDPSSLSFVEALLQFYLLHVISSSSSGSAIRGSGMVPTLLPLLEDSDTAHMGLVCSAVKTLQKLMDYSNAAVSLFKDLGGVELLANRLKTEVDRVNGAGGDLMVTGDFSKAGDFLYAQKRLVKALLKALGSATYAPANSGRSPNGPDNCLISSLSVVFHNVNKFGGDIYFSAVTVMSEIIHKDPTCFSVLHEMGLPDAFLSSVKAGILPSSKALTCVPSGFGAICLNAKGLEAVKETAGLRFLVDIFTGRKYVVAMNEGVVPLANAVEELLRHVSSLRSTGVEIMIEIVEKLAVMGEATSDGSSTSTDGISAMETDSHDNLLVAGDPTLDSISNERFIQLCIFHLMVLVHRIMENAETCRLFVEKKGIEALMKLLLRPSIAQSSEGMSIALHSTVVFKGFTQYHSAPLAQAFCSSLREHLKKALSGISSAGGSCLLAPGSTPDSGIFSFLFVIEFLLFLAASKDTRWVSALLSEFGEGSQDVLVDIGRVHREILWQIALLDDSKVELSGNASGSADSRKHEASTASGAEDQRFSSFRQFIDPILRRRSSSWSVESQFFDLINLYRDLGRGSGFHQRSGIEGASSVRHISSHQSSSEHGGTSSRTEDQQRTYYSSCCDMLRSLSFHISHLFSELGKVMLLPSRRREDPINVSSSTKAVVSTVASIVLDHLNFVGVADPSNSEVVISTKCRFLGKVVDFVDSILLERPESCNPILLNSFYGQGVVQTILTTFEATSQLLFAVNRGGPSPMDTDDGNVRQDEKNENNNSWIYGPLASYGNLMDHLVTSSFIISPFTKNLLAQPLFTFSITFPRDPETFVKVLQSKVLKAVLPIWNDPQFSDCSYEFISVIISIVRHIYSGVEVKNVNVSSGFRATGPPPDESSISMIVEMGFSRSRAEEALRQVGTNSVEMAMEWLFSHPEEIQEDDELARALAMSLGSSDTSMKDDTAAAPDCSELEEEVVQLPSIDELLSTCIKLLQMKDPLAFPVRDFLVMICSQNDGHYRDKVISFILDNLKLSSGNNVLLSALFHVLALVLHDDSAAREVALKGGLVRIALEVLSQWEPTLSVGDKPQVPKWVTVAFLAIDRMLQVDPKQSSEISSAEQSKRDDANNKTPVISDDKSSSLRSVLGVNPRIIDLSEQKRLIEIACRCIQSQLPSETMHVVLQLCATLTKVHSVAITFLEAGGLPSLLTLPTSSLFSGFDSVAAMIVRHILEDPQTLQQAMETEIKHSMLGAPSRLSNGRITPRHFLQNLSSVVFRDAEIFLLAAQSVCEVEMVGERPHIVLLKDREKDKSKEKEKDKDKSKEKEKDKESDKDKQSGSDGRVKPSDSNAKGGKAYKKPPHSFVSVIEFLLDSVLTFVPSLKDESAASGDSSAMSLADMEIDGTASSKAKGKAVATETEESNLGCQDVSATLAKTVFILKLLTEIFLTYASSVPILLRRDTEVSNSRGPIHRNSSGNVVGGNGIFYHVIHNFLPYPGSLKKDGSKKLDGDWRHKLSSRASQFLVAASIRSSESRKRVLLEINNVFCELVDATDGYRVPDCNIIAYVDLLNDILAARSPTGSYISAEASATFIDVGLVHSLTGALRILDLDHSESSKIASSIVKALESVTKEHVHAAEHSSSKEPGLSNPASDENPSAGPAENDGTNRFEVLETVSQPDQNDVAPVHLQSFNGVQALGSSESNTDDMDHDQDLDGNEDDFMHETSEEGGGMVNGNIGNVEISFDIPHNLQENSDEDDDEDDDEEMTGEEGEDGDEDEDEEEEHNNLEEDEVHHMSHADIDHDPEVDEDEFDEDLLEEEEDEEEDDEDGVILRLEESINGINVLEQIEVLGRDNNFSNDALHVMPVEVFGSRRRGRTTSIYNLLGRGTEHGTPLQHPLLIEPASSQTVAHRQTGAVSDDGFPERGIENSLSRLDAIFRTLRNGGRHGHRLNMWSDESQPRGSGSSSGPVIPQGFEELLVSRLRRPSKHQAASQNTTLLQPRDNDDANQTLDTAEVREEINVEPNVNPDVTTAASCNEGSEGTGNVEMGPSDTDMQFDRTDAAVRDVEAVSQESGGSGATLGESLRSLEVEIGSADGHDDGVERQGPSERVRRITVSSGTATPNAGRDASLLQSVSEGVPLSNSELNTSEGGEGEQQRQADVEPIDPAFLEALPEDLRAEVLSGQPTQVAQPPNEQNQSAEDIDPEFLAALPPDIRAELLAQQQAQRLHQSQELEGQPVEMDTVSIIATFPSDLREEVLLTSSDAILANLTPALVAEANMLRERFAHRYSRNFLGMYPRNRRGESSRRADGIGSSLERAIGSISSRRVSGKVIEADGSPLVDQEDLKAMIRLLRVVQPLYKGQLQRLLLNLCAHSETRTSLVQILMGMLMLDIQGPGKNITSSEEQPYRLYACQSHVMYSRPQYSNGVPPLVSRRILETLAYLARNHPYVAKLMLHLELPSPVAHNLRSLDKSRGKAVMIMEEDENKTLDFAVVLLLGLLNLPLYLRSIAHLEQLLSLLEVIVDNVDVNSGQSNKSSSSDEPSGSEAAATDTQVANELSKPASEPLVSTVTNRSDTSSSVLRSLPHSELRLLCSLLARDGLSDNAYVLVAEVLKKLVGIAPTHCHLFMTELAESVQTLSHSAMRELSTYGEAEKVLITTASTDGTAILRVLQALTSLVSLLHEKEKEQAVVEKDSDDAPSRISEISYTLEPLWMELSSCISKIENSPDYGSELPSTSSGSYGLTNSSTSSPLPAGTQNILPYIESFFVTCEKLHPGQSGSGSDTSGGVTAEHEEIASGSSLQKSSSLPARVDEKQVAFVKFSEKHRKLLNAFIRQNPGLLEKSFSLMLQVPRFIDFDNKRAHFKSKIKHQHDHHHSPLRISVRRAYILEDSYNQLRLRSTQDLKGRLTVHFQGEEGIDAGGLTREWYQLLSRVIFDKGALLFTTVGNESTFQPNPNSVYQTEHLSYFKFVGRVVGKALFDGQLLDVHFTRSFYKHILGVKVTYHDIEAIDPDYFKNLKWMLENDISDVLDLTFSMDADEEKLILYEKTEVTDYELKPGGRNIKVTEENKHQYVDLVAEHRLTTAIRPQINAFMEGFIELISRDLISIFNDKELELLISGLPDIDLDDLRSNTEYSGYSAASPAIHWFWEVVQGFSKEDKARLLQFVTGTSKVPLEGFSALQGISGAQRFQIHKAYGGAGHLPSAHTCFNQLDLPEYPTKQQLQERLLMAIHEGSEGFGFG